MAAEKKIEDTAINLCIEVLENCKSFDSLEEKIQDFRGMGIDEGIIAKATVSISAKLMLRACESSWFEIRRERGLTPAKALEISQHYLDAGHSFKDSQANSMMKYFLLNQTRDFESLDKLVNTINPDGNMKSRIIHEAIGMIKNSVLIEYVVGNNNMDYNDRRANFRGVSLNEFQESQKKYPIGKFPIWNAEIIGFELKGDEHDFNYGFDILKFYKANADSFAKNLKRVYDLLSSFEDLCSKSEEKFVKVYTPFFQQKCLELGLDFSSSKEITT